MIFHAQPLTASELRPNYTSRTELSSGSAGKSLLAAGSGAISEYEDWVTPFSGRFYRGEMNGGSGPYSKMGAAKTRSPERVGLCIREWYHRF